MFLENVNINNFIAGSNSIITKNIDNINVSNRINTMSSFIIIKNIVPKPGKYILDIDILSDTKIFWSGTYSTSDRKIVLVNGHNNLTIDISKQQKENFSIMIICEKSTNKLDLQIKNFKIKPIQETLPVAKLTIPRKSTKKENIIPTPIIFSEPIPVPKLLPLVSVILPTYQRYDGFVSVINNFIKQQLTNFEMIIIDDGSDDEIYQRKKSYVEKLSDSRFDIRTNEKNLGTAKSLNKGISLSNGSYITWISDDNEYYPNYLSTLYQPDYEFIYSYWDNKNSSNTSTIKQEYKNVIDLFSCFKGLGAFMWSKNLMNSIGIYNENLNGVEDYEYLIRTFIKTTSILCQQTSTMKFSMHDKSFYYLNYNAIRNTTVDIVKIYKVLVKINPDHKISIYDINCNNNKSGVDVVDISNIRFVQNNSINVVICPNSNFSYNRNSNLLVIPSKYQQILYDYFKNTDKISYQIKNLAPVLVKQKYNMCVISDSAYPGGGGEEFLYDLCMYFSHKHFNVYWISLSTWGLNQHKKYEKKSNGIFTEIYLPYTQMQYSFDIIRKEILSISHVDLILHQGAGHKLVTDIGNMLNIPTISFWCFWEEALDINWNYGIKNIQQNLNNHSKSEYFEYITKNIDHYYFASNFMKDIVNQKYLVNIDEDHVFPTLSNELRIIANRSKNTANYISLLDVHTLKGGKLFADLIRKLPQYNFMGFITEDESEGPDEIRKAIKEVGNPKNLLLERENDVKKIYAKTKILLCPTYLDETFCRVVFEAYANKIAVICSNKGNLGTLKDKNVLVVDDFNTKSYSDLIVRLMTDSDYYLEIVSKQTQIYNEMKSNSNFDRILNKFMKIRHDKSKNIAIFSPWCDQGLGIQTRIYNKLLTEMGYNVAIFSSKPYVQTDKNDLVALTNEWDHNRIYRSPNKRLDITNLEIKSFVDNYKIKKFIIPEIQYDRIFEITSYLKELGVDTYAIPNVECCRDYELKDYYLFKKILVNNNFTKFVLGEKNLNTSLLSFAYDIPKCIDFTYCQKHPIGPNSKIKILHLTGLNGLTRKRTLEIIDIFGSIYQSFKNFELTICIQGNFEKNSSNLFNKPFIKLIYGHRSYGEILSLYSKSDISIQLSKHEGLGLGFHESCYTGTPVLTLDAPPHNEIISHGRNGWLLDCTIKVDEIPENPYTIIAQTQIDKELLIEQIKSILLDRNDINHVISQTKKYYDNKFNLDLFKQNFNKILSHD